MDSSSSSSDEEGDQEEDAEASGEDVDDEEEEEAVAAEPAPKQPPAAAAAGEKRGRRKGSITISLKKVCKVVVGAINLKIFCSYFAPCSSVLAMCLPCVFRKTAYFWGLDPNLNFRDRKRFVFTLILTIWGWIRKGRSMYPLLPNS